MMAPEVKKMKKLQNREETPFSKEPLCKDKLMVLIADGAFIACI